MQALWYDCIRYGLKCLVARAIARASTSHSNHVNFEPRSLVLKKTCQAVTCHYGWRTAWHLFWVCEELCYDPQLITWDGEWDGVSSGKGCLGLVEWQAEVICPLNRLLRFTASDSVIKFCKECRASWDDVGEHHKTSNEWPHSGDIVGFGAWG